MTQQRGMTALRAILENDKEAVDRLLTAYDAGVYPEDLAKSGTLSDGRTLVAAFGDLRTATNIVSIVLWDVVAVRLQRKAGIK